MPYAHARSGRRRSRASLAQPVSCRPVSTRTVVANGGIPALSWMMPATASNAGVMRSSATYSCSTSRAVVTGLARWVTTCRLKVPVRSTSKEMAAVVIASWHLDEELKVVLGSRPAVFIHPARISQRHPLGVIDAGPQDF